MGSDTNLLNLGLVLLLVGPIIGLIVWRLWRGEVMFYGFWKTPSEIEAMGTARCKNAAGEGRPAPRDDD